MTAHPKSNLTENSRLSNLAAWKILDINIHLAESTDHPHALQVDRIEFIFS